MIAIGSKYNILFMSNMLYSMKNSGSFTVVVLMCVRPQLLVCTWLGSSGPDLGPGEHTRSEGLVVGPGPAVVLIASIDNIVVSTYGVCAVGRWIQIGGMFFQ